MTEVILDFRFQILDQGMAACESKIIPHQSNLPSVVEKKDIFLEPVLLVLAMGLIQNRKSKID